MVLMAIAAVACGVDSSSRPGHRLVSSESGVPWARNSGSGAWAEGGAEDAWTARTALEIGRRQGEGADVFGRIAGIAVDSAGTVYVLDELHQEVRAFDRQARHLRSFGGQGGGPDEFDYATRIWIGRDGRPWVHDARRRRLVAFDSAGRSVRTAPAPAGSPQAFSSTELPDGAWIDWIFRRPDRRYTDTPDLGETDLHQPIRITGDGVVDTLPPIATRFPRVGRIRVPLSAQLEIAVAGDGSAWFSHPTEYVLYHRSPAGDTTLIVSLDDAAPAPLQGSLRDSILEMLRVRAQSAPGYRGGWPGPDDLPQHLPAVDRVLLDGAAHLLVLPRVEGVARGGAVDVFDEQTGEYMGRVELPVRIPPNAPLTAAPGALYTVLRDELDVERLVRIDLGRP